MLSSGKIGGNYQKVFIAMNKVSVRIVMLVGVELYKLRM